jgi:hypothetical protein
MGVSKRIWTPASSVPSFFWHRVKARWASCENEQCKRRASFETAAMAGAENKIAALSAHDPETNCNVLLQL